MPGRRVGYRPRRSSAKPTVPQPNGPNKYELEVIALLHPDVMSVIDRAVSVVLNHKLGIVPYANAEEVVNEFILGIHNEDPDFRKWSQEAYGDWKTMLNVVRDIAVADPRYHGIKDPMTEQKCSKCRKIKKLNEFPHGRIRCYECIDKYGYGHNGVEDAKV